MTDPNTGVSESELHALVDGQLDTLRIPDILDWLRDHPDDALRVAQWQAQRLQLRQMHRALDLGETPPALIRTVTRANRWLAPRMPPSASVTQMRVPRSRARLYSSRRWRCSLRERWLRPSDSTMDS